MSSKPPQQSHFASRMLAQLRLTQWSPWGLVAAGPIYPQGPQITVSIGVAEFTGLDTLDRCINRADKALYRAKTDGRNRVYVGM